MCLRTCLSLLPFQCLSLACCCFSRGPSETYPTAHSALGPFPPWFLSRASDSVPRAAVEKVPSSTFHFPGCVSSHQRPGGQIDKGGTLGTFTLVVEGHREWLEGQGRRQRQVPATPARTCC